MSPGDEQPGCPPWPDADEVRDAFLAGLTADVGRQARDPEQEEEIE